MRVAVIGSTKLKANIKKYIPNETTELISGGECGIGRMVEDYADECDLPRLIIRKDYRKNGLFAPLERNRLIVDCAQMVIAIWNGKSKGIRYMLDYANSKGIPNKEYIIKPKKA